MEPKKLSSRVFTKQGCFLEYVNRGIDGWVRGVPLRWFFELPKPMPSKISLTFYAAPTENSVRCWVRVSRRSEDRIVVGMGGYKVFHVAKSDAVRLGIPLDPHGSRTVYAEVDYWE